MKYTTLSAVSAFLVALLLTGSTPKRTYNLAARSVGENGAKLYDSAHYSEARRQFLKAAALAEATGDARTASMNWANAGACSLVEMQFSAARQAFTRASGLAQRSGEAMPLASALNNLASLYIHMGDPEAAIRTATEALAGPGRRREITAALHAKLGLQLAIGLMEVHRYDQALPVYRQVISDMTAAQDFNSAARALSTLAYESLNANRLDEAASALNDGLRLVREEKADALPGILEGLAKLRARQGDNAAAAAYFDQALAERPNGTPRWRLLASRAQFRLTTGNLQGAMTDFRAARAIAMRMRLDMVPADQDRVHLESGLIDVAQGLVEAGNKLARQSGDAAILEETFDAAEQDRQWSLRALIPGLDNWRSRLPETYWDLLARYQSLERTALANATPDSERIAAQAGDELQRLEAQAGQNAQVDNSRKALSWVRTNLGVDSVLLSFYISKNSSWVWAVDRQGTAVYPLPSYETIEHQSAAFAAAVHQGGARAASAGRNLYTTLFGGIPPEHLRHSKWILEPDGPLYNVAFAALVVNREGEPPVYLVEKAELQSLPGALLLLRGTRLPSGRLLAVGDAVYNGADPRYAFRNRKPGLTLPRLPNTAASLHACSRAWGTGRTQLLTGTQAGSAYVAAALARNPDIIHFATHVVPSPADYRTGLIALSLDANGAMGVLGPREIVARPVSAALVVMDGCHSAQAEALPGAGLMGLTRAWIGAGAAAVLATQWDIPDDDSQLMMEAFYRAMAAPGATSMAQALRKAQLAQLPQENSRTNPARWAGYFLESRTQ